jgi:hypothetical protein
MMNLFKKDNATDSVINPALLWEYNLADFDYLKMRHVVVQRVIERGWPNDWKAMLHLYGEEGTKQIIKELAYLDDIDTNFVSIIFTIPLTDLKCYTKKRLNPTHWNF